MAAREFPEIWGKSMHAVRHLRIVTGTLSLVILVLGIAMVRLACPPQPKPLVATRSIATTPPQSGHLVGSGT